MHGKGDPAGTVVSRVVRVASEAVYRAFLDPGALAAWLPPEKMIGVVHAFDRREGGSFRMSLRYPDDERIWRGKTAERTDTFRARFAELVPNERVVWAVEFESSDPSFAGEVIVTATLVPAGSGTEVMLRCDNIPPGIRPEDSEAGTRASLEKLAAFVGG